MVMMAIDTEPGFAARLRAWLLSRPVAELCAPAETGGEGLARRSVYDWLNGHHLPRGLARRYLELRIGAWEQAQAPSPSRIASASSRGGALRLGRATARG